MDIQTVIQDFAACGHKLPKASMQWSLDHWDECGPHFLDHAALRWNHLNAGNVIDFNNLEHAFCEKQVPAFSQHALALLERFIRGEDRSRGTAETLIFAVHLMGQQRERRAFEPLCALVADVDLLEELLGEDGSTTSLAQLLVGTFDGRDELLKALIEDAMADEFVRHSALNAFAYLTHRGDVAPQATRDYLRWLRTKRCSQEKKILLSWASSTLSPI